MKSQSPIIIIIFSFLGLITVGAVILMLPCMAQVPFNFIDALFTSTSAVCVTGLIVRDTATELTRCGQITVLVLIQLGGLGIMTFSLGIIAIISRDLAVRWQFAFMNIYGGGKALPIRRILLYTVIYTFLFELIIALLLFIALIQRYPVGEAVYISIFHAVSSFCNAGFSTYSDSLMGFSTDPYIIIVISFSIIAGGIGFLVLGEFSREGLVFKKGRLRKLTIHSKIVLTMTLFLLGIGTLLVLYSEWGGVLAQYDFPKKLLLAFFQSVTCRTAGFNSVDIAQLKDNTLFFMTGLMIVGGSPGSIAGGIKTTTLWVILAIVVSRFRNQRQVIAWNRAISNETVEQSTMLFILALLIVSFTALVLSSFNILPEEVPFIHRLFEAASAFGTVGLSAGVTAKLSSSGRLVIALLMLIGRLGPLSLIAAVTSHLKRSKIKYPVESIMIG